MKPIFWPRVPTIRAGSQWAHGSPPGTMKCSAGFWRRECLGDANLGIVGNLHDLNGTPWNLQNLDWKIIFPWIWPGWGSSLGWEAFKAESNDTHRWTAFQHSRIYCYILVPKISKKYQNHSFQIPPGRPWQVDVDESGALNLVELFGAPDLNT